MTDRKVFKLDQNKAKETKQRLQEEAQRNQLPMWKIPEGESKIRILPPWSEAGDIAFECKSHWRIPPNDRMVNCLTVINQECPVCELVKELRAKGKAELASKFGAKKSIYYNVLVRGEEDKGVQIMRSGIQLYENILSYLYDDEYGDITCIDEGSDITIERSGQGLDTSYNVKIARKTSPLSPDAKKATKLINEMFLLDEILDFKPSAELNLLVSNITGKRATTVNEEEVPLLEADATVATEPTTTDTPETVVEEVEDADAKKQKLLDELNKIV
jgi:hypothetical protein